MSDNSEGIAEYRRNVAKRLLFIAVSAIVLMLILGYSVCIGHSDISLLEAYGYIWDHITGNLPERGTVEWRHYYVIVQARLPELVFATIGGAALAVGGAAMQNVMNNPLADPYTTGISSGASLGVAIAAVTGFTMIGSSTFSQIGVMANAFVFSLIPLGVILLVSKKMNTSPASLILAGVAMSYFFGSLTSMLMMMADENTLKDIMIWQMGNIVNMTWDDIPLMAIVCTIGIIIMYMISRQLNILSMGDKEAKALGLDVEKIRLLALIVLSLMVASVISYAGIIGFVGLICPHIVRTIIGSDNRFVIPASIFVGAITLLGAKLIATYVSVNFIEIPVGVVLSLIGAPIFLYLIIRRNSNVW